MMEYANLRGIDVQAKNLLLQNEDVKITSLLYEIRLHPDNNKLIFRIYNYSKSTRIPPQFSICRPPL